MGGGIPDLTTTSPEMIRKEVIPNLVRMGQEGRDNGSINEVQFRDFMAQVETIFPVFFCYLFSP